MNRDGSGADRRLQARLANSQRKFLAHLARGHNPECFEYQDGLPLVLDMIRFGVGPDIEIEDEVRILRECPACREVVEETLRSEGAEVPAWWSGVVQPPSFLEGIQRRLRRWFEAAIGQMELVPSVPVPVVRAGTDANRFPRAARSVRLAIGDEFSVALRGGPNGCWVWVWMIRPPPPEGPGTAMLLYPPRLQSGFAPSRISPGEVVAFPLIIQPGTEEGTRVLIGLFSSSMDLDARFATQASEYGKSEDLLRFLESFEAKEQTAIRVEVTELVIRG